MSIKDFFSAGPGRAFVIIALVICAASFYVGRGMGYDTGKAVAAVNNRAAEQSAHQAGYDEAKEEFYDNRFAAGKLEGIKQGKKEMRDIYEPKLEAEYDKGYNKGLEDGRIEAYNSMAGIEAEDQYLAGEAPYTSSDPIDPNSYQVYYTTRAGEKYHTRICGHLKGHEWNNMSLADAWSKHYEPCADCDPPSREDVYGP